MAQITPNIINFLVNIHHHNSKAWMDEHRDEYKQAKADFEQIVEELITGIHSFDARIEKLEPKNFMYRVNRDIRFGKNKLPYKEHFSAFIAPGGKKWDGAGYYVHIEPFGQNFLGVGNYEYNKTIIENFRNSIHHNPKPFLQVVKQVDATDHFEPLEGKSLKRIPRGFAKDHPHADLLKMTTYTYRHNFTKQEIKAKDFSKVVLQYFKELAPFAKYLNDLKTE